jgi:hypothetical protein
MAQLIQRYQNTKEVVVIPYFFRIGYSACSTNQFLKAALLRLHAAISEPLNLAATTEERRRQLILAIQKAGKLTDKKVIFLIDGLDEIYRLEPSFISLLFAAKVPHVIWICAGRPEPEMESILRENGTEWVFNDGLPKIDAAAIRALLTDQLEREKYILFDRDKSEGNESRNRFIEVLARKSEGVPLYVRMVVEDVREGKWTLSDEDKLPNGLRAYFEQVLERLRVSDVGAVLTPLFCLLALAKEPITESSLSMLLSNHYLSKLPRWQELFHKTLEHGHLMLRRASTSEGMTGWTFYHDSFRQHLLTSETVKDNREWANAEWLERCGQWETLTEESLRRYALRHYPRHLCESDHIDELAVLLGSRFLSAKIDRIGPTAAHADCMLGAQVAASKNDDKNFIRFLRRGGVIKLEAEASWTSGRWALELLRDDPIVIADIARILGGQKLPWTAFLAAERLIDIGETQRALSLLRDSLDRGWSTYKQPNVAHGMSEGSSWDFVPNQGGTIEFLALMARYDAALAIDLTSRLFVDRPGILPNPKTAWREVLRQLKRQTLEPAFVRQLCESTIDWISKGGYVLGLRTLSVEVLELLSLTVPTVDEHWFANALKNCFDFRFQSSGKTELEFGWACADILETILKMTENCGEGHDFQRILVQCAEEIASGLPTVTPPTEGKYNSNRSDIWARLASSLFELRNERWHKFAEAALASSEKDGELDDPPIAAVSKALIILENLPPEETAQAAKALHERLRPVLDRYEKAKEETTQGEGNEITTPELFKTVENAKMPYKRIRAALELKRRGMNDSRIAEQLIAGFHEEKPSQQSIKFTDALAEALVQAIAKSGETQAENLITGLDEGRDPNRRKQVSIRKDAILTIIYRSWIEAGRTDALRTELKRKALEASENRDINQLLFCCLSAISFDPDLAEVLYRMMPEDLDDLDKGMIIVLIVSSLATCHPRRIDDLGKKWVEGLPLIDNETDIAEYQLYLCSSWGDQDIFRPIVLREVRSLSQWINSHLSGDSPMAQTTESDEDRQWRKVGAVLDAIGCVRVTIEDDSQSLIEKLLNGVRSSLEMIPTKDRRLILFNLLKEIESELQPGPVAAMLTELFSESVDSKGPGTIGADLDAELALNLATRLRKAEPEWAECRAADVLERWQSQLKQESPAEDTLERAANALLDVFTTSFQGLRSHRDMQLRDTTDALVKWYSLRDYPNADLAVLQTNIEGIEDIDLRSLLLALITCGWVEARELNRARLLVDVLDVSELERGGVHDSLATLSRARSIDRTTLKNLNDLSLHLALLTPPDTEAFVEALTAFLNTRVKMMPAGVEREQYITAMLNTHQSLLASESW